VNYFWGSGEGGGGGREGGKGGLGKFFTYPFSMHKYDVWVKKSSQNKKS
jgi:hypothetical protein